MSYVENLGEKLARDVLKAQKETGDLNMVQNIGQVLEASSSTLHEAFMTAVRVYDAEERARKALAQMLNSRAPR
jgi:selenocysteine lyase/cysteine desulfurase